MAFSKSSLPPDLLSFYFIISVIIVPIFCQIPPGRPVIVINPSSGKLGTSATVTCSSQGGDPTPTVKISRNGALVDETATTANGQTVNDYTFTVTESDHYAVYECSVANGVLQNPLTSTEYFFVVTTPLAPTLNGPTVVTTGTGPQNWTCISRNGYPMQSMTMRNDNTQFTSGFTTSSTIDPTSKKYVVTGTLIWTPTLGDNGHTLYCDVSHSTLTSPQTISLPLTVIAPLAVNAPITSYTPTIGNTVTLNCVVTSGIATSITWFKENIPITISANSRLSGGTVATPPLTIANVQQSDQGNYVCQARDAVGTTVNTNTIILSPQGTPPVVTIAQPSYSQLTGQQITLGCTYQSPNSPVQSVLWRFTNSQGVVTDPVVISSPKYSGSTLQNPSLTITSLGAADKGTYQCRATNLIGTGISDPTTLDVTGSQPVVVIPQNSYSGIYGNQVVIECIIQSANPAATVVYWQKNVNNVITRINNGDSGYQGSTPTTPSLTINFARTSDNGVYTCYATNAVGTGSSNPTTLTISGGLLSVTLSPSTANVIQGNSQTIQCIVNGQPPATQIEWIKDQTTTLNIANSNGKYTGGTVSNPALTITNFQSTDAGQYVCRATNAAGVAPSSPSTLTLIQPLSVSVSPPSGNANYGTSSYTIQCIVSGTNPSFVSWTKTPITGGTTTTISTGSGKYNINNSPTNPFLTILNIVEEDEADYACSAQNLAGTVTSSNARLIVDGASLSVNVSPTSANVILNNNQAIQCIVSGSPSATAINWYRRTNNVETQIQIASSNGKYSGGSVSTPALTVNSFQSSDAGVYLCKATNAYGTASSPDSVLTFIQPISISIQPLSGTAIVGDALYTITCTVFGTNPTFVSWTKTPTTGGTSTTLTQGTGKYSINSSPTNPTLTISNIVKTDEADYACSAQNLAGTVTSSNARLAVNGGALTVTITPTNPTAVIGDATVQIQCTISGIPQATNWYWTFLPLGSSGSVTTIPQGTNSADYFVENSNTNPHLTIRNILKTDEGDYVCFGTNVVGTSQSNQARLTVTGGLLGVQISPNNQLVIQGNSQTLTCIVSGSPPASAITWTKQTTGGAVVMDLSTPAGKYSGGTTSNPSLTINNFQSTDAATYVCRATNAAGTASSTQAVLTYAERLTLTVSPVSGSADIGTSSYVINCVITGSPAATQWSWIKTPTAGGTSSTITMGTNTNKYTVANNANNPSLTIMGITTDDDANYVCQATNTAGQRTSAPARLLVTGSLLSVIVTPNLSSPNYGTSSITIQCAISGSPGATTVGWTKNAVSGGSSVAIDAANSQGKYFIVNSFTNPDLTINNINFNDDAYYVCSATNAVGKQNSGNARVQVIGSPPQVSIPSTTYNVVYGNDITIPCTIINANPTQTSIRWYRIDNNNQASTINVGDLTQYSGGTLSVPSLTILKADSTDAGTYRCGAINVVGEGQSSNTLLNVIGGLLQVTIPSPTYSVLLGNQIQMVCTVSGSPAATQVYWEKKNVNGTYNRVAADSRYSGGNLASPTLVIFNAAFSDKGTYRCLGVNAAGTANSIDTQLDVTGNVPIVQISTTIFPVLVSNQITLGCNVIADPAATSVYWTFADASGRTNTITQTTNTQKYGGVTLSSPSLILYNAQFSDAGKYTCYAINSVGTGNSQTADLVVNGEPPKVQITLPNYSVDFGQSVTLGCTVTANPPHFRVFWRKTRNNIQTDIIVSSSNGKYSGATVTNPSLTINNAALDDQASYVCGAENSVNSAVSTQTILTVTGNIPVVNIRQSQYSVNYGSPVTLECTVTAVPDYTHVYWQKIQNGITTTVVVSNDPRLSGSTKGTPSLTFSSTNLNDVAQYICFANNSVGIGQSNPTSLIVSGAVPQVFVSSNSYSVPVGGAVTLQCVVNANPTQTQVRWRRIINGVETDVTGVGAVGSGSRLTGSEVNNPSLFVTLADFADEGNYICTATNAVGTGRSQQTFLDVTGTPPVVTVSALEFQGDFGKSVTMTCTVNANPKETRVYWRMLVNGVLTDVDMTSGRYSGSTVASPSLTISNLNKADQAYYQCFAQNSVATGSSQQTYLRVIGEIPVVTVQGSVSVTLGQSAVISCTVTANPAAQTVFWRKYNSLNQLVDIDMTTNNNNKYQGSTVGTPSLTILNTVSDDAGRYVCYATNAVGTGFSSTATTLSVVGGIPIVNIPQDSYSVNIGNQITLGCTVSATPTEHTIYWTKKVGTGAEVQVSKTNSAKYQGQIVNSPSLIILNTDFTDSATYYCYAQNAAGTGKSNPTVLTVIGNQPTVTIPLPQYSVNYDGAVTIPCTVTASPAATNITWKKIVQGVEQNIDINQVKYSGATTQNPSLTINNANSNDKAFYVCTATNSVGTGRSIQTYLDVVGAIPTVTVGSNSYSVLKTKSQELVCNINANPAATSVQWYRYENGQQTNLRNVAGKYNSPTVNSPNLIVYNADDLDRGYYVCTATNIIGRGVSSTTFLDVTGNAPLVTIPLTTYNGNIGGTVTIGCTVVANPAATSVWWQVISGGQSTNILQSTSKYSFSTSNPSLTISSLSSADKAYYVCYATNDIGQGNSGQAYVNVIGSIPIVTVPQSSYDANIGSSVTLQCTVSANPTHTSVYWKRVDANSQVTTITIDNSKYQGATVNNPSLTINNVQTTDRASYICFAHNTEGDGQSNPTYLNVIGSPPIVSIGSSSYSVAFGQSIQLVCTINANPSHFAVSWKKIQNGVETVIDSSAITNNPSKYAGGSVSQPSLTVKNADRNMDQAFYECSATNSIGTGTSSRTYLMVTGDVPLVQIPNSLYSVELGQNLVVPCTITSNPAHYSVQWKRRDGNGVETDLNVSDQTQYTNGNLNVPSLTILNAANDDKGFYICTATNAVGTGRSGLTYVDVTGSVLQVTVPQSAYNVNYGQTVQLVCTVTGTPAVQDVYWVKIRNGQSTTIRASTDPSKYSGVSLSNPSLTILNANEVDTAVYRCYGTNAVGTSNSQQTQLNVIGSAPSVTVGQGYTVNLGNSVTLQCTVIATPSATSVRWNKIQGGISSPIDVVNNPTKYSGSTTSIPSLTIYNADNNDQTSYTCQATNAAGTTVSTPTSLSVVGNIPIVRITQGQYSVVIGNTVTLECTVTANPTHYVVYWKRIINGVETDLPSSGRYSGSTVSNPSLTITNTVVGDIGSYVCFANNTVGRGQSAQTYLNVVGSAPVVSIPQSTYSTNIGNPVTLQCTVSANPIQTSVKWQRVDSNNNAVDVDMTNSRYSGSTVSSPSLTISNAVKADEGRYICIATNLVGTGTSGQTFLTVVGSSPTVTVPDPSYSVNRGSSVTLQCAYSANPAATRVRWLRNNVEIDLTNTLKYGGSLVSSASLIIKNADKNDEGTYVCQVTNDVGTGISTPTTLSVVGNPPTVTVATGAYTVNVGSSVTLQCAVTADPAATQVYWQRADGGTTTTIIIDNSKYSGSAVGNPSLVINNAAFTDAGTYYCYAVNSVGVGGSTQVVVGVTGNKPSVSLPRTSITANYGDDVTIACDIVANPKETSVYWQKSPISGGNAVTIDMTNTAKYSGSTVAVPALTIKKVDLSDIARYVCFAANSVGTGRSTNGTLNVVGSQPTVTIGQDTYTANIGNSIIITCTVSSFPAHTSVYWTKQVGGNPQMTISTTTTKYSISSNLNAPSLTIFDVDDSDAGMYRCFATNIVGTGQSSAATLNVIGNPPVVAASPALNSVRIGQSITLMCTITANPAATNVVWQKVVTTGNTDQYVNIDRTLSKYTGGTVQIPSLTINPVAEDDRGNYRCVASNAIGTTNSNQISLETIGDPPTGVKVTPTPIVVNEGNTIQATCTANGNPAPTFQWYKSTDLNTVISTGSELRVPNALDTNKGTYICRAMNKFGTNDAQVTVDVQFVPKVTISNLGINGTKGNSIDIKCTQTSNPLATEVYWTKITPTDSRTVIIDNIKYIGGSVSNPTLTITNLDGADEASYRCSARNSVGPGSSQLAAVKVDLNSAPIGIRIYPDGITVLEGHPFSMYCNATAYPDPQYQWFHDDIMIREGQVYSVDISDYNKHDGLYTCKAYNSKGFQQATIDVDVKFPPISSVKTNSISAVVGTPVTLSCDSFANPSAVKWNWYYNDILLTSVPDTQKTYMVDMNKATDAGLYSCVAFNEVGQSGKIEFTLTVGLVTTTAAPVTVTGAAAVGQSLALSGLSGGEIAAIVLGILFFILLLIALIVCCILQGCCICCAAAGAKDKERRITPDREITKVDIPRFYEVPTVVTREPSLISKRDVSLHMAPVYRPSNEYEITKYRVVRPEEYVGEQYITTTAARPYYLPPIEYTYDEEERRRRRRKKKKSKHHHDELRPDEQIILEERVVGGGDVYRTSTRSRYDDEVVTGPEFYFEAE